jgi:hypothetical protein
MLPVSDMRRLAVLVMVTACASAAPGPDDMSADQHRLEAARERSAARERLLAHGGRARIADVGGGGMLPAGLIEGGDAARDRSLADAYLAHARLHEAAADELERQEEAACRGMTLEERADCPELRGAGAVIDVKDGIEIRFFHGAPVDDVERRMRCHLAFAKAHGSGCPLYGPGATIERLGPRVVRLVRAR